MKYFSLLIKPSSSYCTMRCTYCFYDDVAKNREVANYGFMKEEVMEAMLENTFSYFDEPASITFAFQGGEPTCVGLSFFKKFIDKVNSLSKEFHTISYAIQTNGFLLNKDWFELFKEHHFLVGLSIDGFMENHDKHRFDMAFRGTFSKIIHNYHSMIDLGIDVNVLTVLTNELSQYPERLYRFYQKHDIRYIQLIPCLGFFDNDKNKLEPINFFNFYDVFFDCWLAEVHLGVVRSVSYFDHLVSMLKGIPPNQCGMLGFCSPQFVIEGDGSVFPCDFYVLDKYKIGNIAFDSIGVMAKNKLLMEFIGEKRNYSLLCKDCRYYGMCHGNCKRMTSIHFTDDFCALKSFIEKKEYILVQLSKLL